MDLRALVAHGPVVTPELVVSKLENFVFARSVTGLLPVRLSADTYNGMAGMGDSVLLPTPTSFPMTNGVPVPTNFVLAYAALAGDARFLGFALQAQVEFVPAANAGLFDLDIQYQLPSMVMPRVVNAQFEARFNNRGDARIELIWLQRCGEEYVESATLGPGGPTAQPYVVFNVTTNFTLAPVVAGVIATASLKPLSALDLGYAIDKLATQNITNSTKHGLGVGL